MPLDVERTIENAIYAIPIVVEIFSACQIILKRP